VICSSIRKEQHGPPSVCPIASNRFRTTDSGHAVGRDEHYHLLIEKTGLAVAKMNENKQDLFGQSVAIAQVPQHNSTE
jgi:hypothetical protein